MAKRTCIVDQCSRPQHGRGLCQTHYGRWRHGRGVTGVAPKRRADCETAGCPRVSYARGKCTAHYRAWLREVGAQRKPIDPDYERGMKLCPSCDDMKPLSEFAPDKSNRAGVASWCRPCVSAANRRYRATMTPEQRTIYLAQKRDARLRAAFGIGAAEYDALLAKQGGGCAVCGATHGTRRLAVDHDHATGAIRGILCHPCNTSLGLMDEDPIRLHALAAYLKHPSP